MSEHVARMDSVEREGFMMGFVKSVWGKARAIESRNEDSDL
jgi:hypothetical protein